MKNKIFFIFVGLFIFQMTTQINFVNVTFITSDFCEEAGDESELKEDIKQDAKITNLIDSNFEKTINIYSPLGQLNYEITLSDNTYQSVETPPPNPYNIPFKVI